MKRILLVLLLVGCERTEPTLARMQTQRRADPYAASSAFPDGKVMQTPVADTVARDAEDEEAPPPPITRELLELGRRRFDVVCAACHGVAGDGRSYVAPKMEQRPPPSLHQARITRERVFSVATEGYGLMPSFAPVLPLRERWAVASYVRALQVSQGIPARDLPAAWQEELP